MTAVQALSFAFLRGFLPHSADEQYYQAKKNYLINDLGRPDVSSFAAYGYAAGLHVDRDICVSHGWVFQRSEHVCLKPLSLPLLHLGTLQVTRKESNFVYGDYKLIVELSHDARWFWDAKEDAHGTTSNNVAMSKPKRWKDCIVSKPDMAQWTYAQTIPKAVANATLNQRRLYGL